LKGSNTSGPAIGQATSKMLFWMAVTHQGLQLDK
jgi:hypothetical protein